MSASVGQPATDRRDLLHVFVLGLLLVAAFALRMWLGDNARVDADQATLGLESLKVLHGEHVLMEMNGHYLGGLEGYLVAVFIAIFGPTKFALRLPLALVGTAYVLTMYLLGRRLLRGRWPALLLAALAAVSPGYLVSYTMRPLGGHAELPMFIALVLLLAAGVGWGAGATRLVSWVLLGLTAGLGTWSDPSLAMVVVLVALVLLLRAPAVGWANFLRGGAAATTAAVIGFSPWLYFNLRHHMLSITSLRDTHPHTFAGFQDVASAVNLDVPAFLGARYECEVTWVPGPWVSYIAIAVLLGGLVLTVRRVRDKPAPGGGTMYLQPAQMVLLAGLGALAIGILGAGDVPPCDARLMLPLGPPVLFGIALLATAGPVPRVLAGATAAGLVLLAVLYIGALPHDDVAGAQVAAANYLEQRGGPAYSYYWTGRPLMYFSSGRVPVAEYRGTPTFPEVEAAADASPRPNWIFAANDPDLARWVTYAQARGITYDRWQQGEVVLFTNLSGAIRPHDVGLDAPLPP